MSADSPPTPIGAIAAQLRAAGCVFAQDEAELLIRAAHTPAELAEMIGRRVAGLPLEHVLGWAEFSGLRVEVDPGVFVPRRRSEFLVERAAASVSSPGGLGRNGRPLVVDLCCGSGALGLALATALGSAEVHAVDIEPAAVRCAARNLAAAGGTAYLGNLYEPLPARLRGRVDVLIANAPYVPAGEVALMPPEARDHEPLVALDGGPDGLDVLRAIAADAAHWLAPDGHLLFETSARQSTAAKEFVTAGGLVPVVVSCEDLGATVVIGGRPAA